MKLLNNINWKVRLKQKTFLVSLFAFIILVLQEGCSVLGLTFPVTLSEELTTLFNAILGFLVLTGVVVDPTTKGMSDSENANEYDTPR